MKNTIIFDSRGAGEGKTTTGIYPGIKLLRRLMDMQILLVVPSVKLQDQYHNDLPDLIPSTSIINSEIDYETMNKPKDNVSRRLLDRMTHQNSGVICITHEAFIRTHIPNNLRQNWVLIIDEALNPWNYQQIRLDGNITWNPKLDFGNLFFWENPQNIIPGDNELYHKLCVSTIPDHFSFSDSEQFKQITHKNQMIWIKQDSFNKLSQTVTGHAELILELNPNIFEDWASVHIAAAAFEHTFMYKWFEYNQFKFECKHPFVIQKKPMRLHTVDHEKFFIKKTKENKGQKGFLWSNRKRTNNPEILKDYHDYISKNFNKDILVVRNNKELQYMANETRIPHTAHGLNQYTNYCAVSLESALILNPGHEDFLNKHVGIERKDIIRAHGAYTFYQILMRTALRLKDNTNPVDVGILDYEIATELMSFIEFNDVFQKINITYMPSAITGRPKGSKGKTIAMSSTERSRKHREKQKELAKQLSELEK